MSLHDAHLIERAIEQAPVRFSSLRSLRFSTTVFTISLVCKPIFSNGGQTSSVDVVLPVHQRQSFYSFVALSGRFYKPVMDEEIILETPTPSPFRREG